MQKIKFSLKSKHFFFLGKIFSGVSMLSISIFGIIILADPALFSAYFLYENLTNSSDLIKTAQKAGGALPGSPLYKIENKVHKNNSSKRVFILFLKFVKTLSENRNLTEEAYQTFFKNLESLNIKEQEILLKKIINELKYVDINHDIFPYALRLFALKDQELFWIQQWLLYSHKNYINLNKQAHLIFSTIEQKENWKKFIIEKNLISYLKHIKSKIIKTSSNNSENFHAASDTWIQDSELWQSL